jgi:hypothetical protein
LIRGSLSWEQNNGDPTVVEAIDRIRAVAGRDRSVTDWRMAVSVVAAPLVV